MTQRSNEINTIIAKRQGIAQRKISSQVWLGTTRHENNWRELWPGSYDLNRGLLGDIAKDQPMQVTNH